MNEHDFEQQLRKQPPPSIPGEWRGEILRAAREAAAEPVAPPAVTPGPWWRQWLWPCPQAWAGLAAVWLVILILNFASRPEGEPSLHAKTPPSPELVEALREQEQFLAELLNPDQPPPEAAAPRPRSHVRIEIIAV